VNKKLNTVLFILGATLVNILTMLLILVLGLVFIFRVLPESVQESIGQFMSLLLFLVAIGGSFYAYHRIIKYVSKKVDLDKYFHPIFRPGKKK
jgi:ABC-type Na+ efflux pump permease subunit